MATNTGHHRVTHRRAKAQPLKTPEQISASKAANANAGHQKRRITEALRKANADRARLKAGTPNPAVAESNRRRAEPAPANQPVIAGPWPTARQCHWPTNDNRPWDFCRAPIAPGEHKRGPYCAAHRARDVTMSRPTGAIDASNMGQHAPRAFILPDRRSNKAGPLKGAERSSANRRSRKQ